MHGIVAIAFLFWVPFIQAQIRPEVAYHKAEISFQTSKWDEALKEYHQLVDDSSITELAPLYYRISQCHEKLGRLDKALLYAENALKQDSTEDEYLIQLAKLHELKYRFSEAWPIRIQLLNRQPRYISRYFAAIDNAKNRKQYSDVLDLSQKWIFQFGRNVYITEVESEAFVKMNQPDRAFLAFDSLIQRYPERSEYRAKKEALKKELNQTSIPKNYLPNQPKINEALKLLDEGNPGKAYEILQEVVKEDPENLQAHKYQFLSAYLDNNIEGLNKVLESIYILYPFLEDIQKTAEWIVSFKTKKNMPLELDKLTFTAEWEFIKIDIHLKLGNVKKAQSLWSSIQQHLQIQKIIPKFYRNQLNEQLKSP
jgi:tetratricopeptide (TPR) repeat protein